MVWTASAGGEIEGLWETEAEGSRRAVSCWSGISAGRGPRWPLVTWGVCGRGGVTRNVLCDIKLGLIKTWICWNAPLALHLFIPWQLMKKYPQRIYYQMKRRSLMLSRLMQTLLVCCRCVCLTCTSCLYTCLFNVYAKAKQTLLFVSYTGATWPLYKCSHCISRDKSVKVR